MKRRQFNTLITSAAAGVMLGGTGVFSEPGDQRPNVLFIMTDQQSANMMSAAGNSYLKTPAMDSIAASGIRYERAYCTNPVCVPSRVSLQTGLMPSAVGVGTNDHVPDDEVAKQAVSNSLGNLFRNAGYETAYGGKTHFPSNMSNIEELGYTMISKDRRLGLGKACAEFIKQKHDKPFMLFASFINPHDICYMSIDAYQRAKGEPIYTNEDARVCQEVLETAAKSEDLSKFIRENCPPLPDNFEIPEQEPECIAGKYPQTKSFRSYTRARWTEEDWRLHRWAYCRLTEMVDKEISVVLKALRDSGLEENTLVVFTSDHGDMDAAHRLEHKSLVYEEVTRIPFLMIFKGRIPEGTVDDSHLISNGLDLLPTLCDYAGIEPPGNLEGRSLREIAEGKHPEDWRDFVVSETIKARMIRTHDFKYSIHSWGENREQLTDMKNDPGEMLNLAGQPDHEATVNEFRRSMRHWVERTGDSIAKEYIL